MLLRYNIISLIICSTIFAQLITNTDSLNQFASNLSLQYKQEKQLAIDFAGKHNIPIQLEFDYGTMMEIQSIRRGIPRYNITTNLGGAKTVRTNKLWKIGGSNLNLTGNGYNKLGKWDGGRVRLSHQEFIGRVYQIDAATSLSTHATHVAGSLVAAGIDPNAKGMAFEAFLDDYDWNNDESEMATAASNGMEVSNHSLIVQ